jgi:hypothetical protein
MSCTTKSAFGSAFCASIGMLSPIDASLALDWQVRTKPGEEVVTHSYTAGITATCQVTGIPKITFTAQPVGGSVDIRKANLKVAAKRHDDDRDIKDPCVGMSLEGVSIYYMPRGDFHGTDRISYIVAWPRSRVRDTVTIVVEQPISENEGPVGPRP